MPIRRIGIMSWHPPGCAGLHEGAFRGESVGYVASYFAFP